MIIVKNVINLKKEFPKVTTLEDLDQQLGFLEKKMDLIESAQKEIENR